MRVAIITINQPSLDSALTLLPYLYDYDVDLYAKYSSNHELDDMIVFDRLDDILPQAWAEYDIIIPILAIGAVVRKIAPLLRDKSTDPAVVVVDLALSKILPLVGGHIAGANEFSNILALRLPNAINFISTATDQTNTLAFDNLAKSRGWEILNLKSLANISNRLLNKEVVKVATYKSIFDSIESREYLRLIDFDDIDEDSVVISPIVDSNYLTLRPKIYLGIGCNRGTTRQEIKIAVGVFLQRYGLSIDQIDSIASFEAKRDEEGLLEFAKESGLCIEFFDKESINALEIEFSHSASTKFFGLKGVAEPSAILVSKYRELIIKKEVYNSVVTIAGAL